MAKKPVALDGLLNTESRPTDATHEKAAFKSERDRVEHLFQLYEKMTDPL